jgi:XTP/dITP diphosphohydrolase
MADIVFATRNIHKTREFQRLLSPEFSVRDLSTVAQVSPPPETGTTFEENAALKATGVSRQMSGLVVADDSGLEVDELGGAPGIYSARYAGENATDRQNIDKLLHELRKRQSVRDSTSARFRCVIALARDGKLLRTFSGAVEGKIVDPPRGRSGFGYDPVFQPNGFEMTFGEMTEDMKNGISHRAQAAAQLGEFLRTARPTV